MADLSKIKLNGTEYDIKDAVARAAIPTDISDLTDTNNVIPAAQVQSDWNATTGMGVILNKPNTSTFMVKGTDYVTAGQKSGTTLGTGATAEGYNTTASGNYSHAEGNNTLATEESSHAEGNMTQATGGSSHAEGSSTNATGSCSHAEGLTTTASGNMSHAEGYNTTAQRRSQHVFGEYNILDTQGTATSSKGKYIEIVGNGTSSTRSNARTLDWSGNEVLAGKLTVGAAPTNNMDVATKQYVDNAIPTVPTDISDLTDTNNIIPAAQVQSDWNATSGMGEILNKPTIPADISDLTDTNRVIPTVPETVSSFQNDAGYLTSFTETDPTVPSWAKAVSKPTYTASEVGALPDTTTYVSSFNGSTGAITYSAPVSSVNGDTGAVVIDKVKTTAASTNTEYTLIGTANTNANTSAVTTYQQDLLSFAKTSSLSRLTIGSTSTPGTIRLYSSASSASGFSEIKSNASSTNERTITLPDASGTVALTTDIPSISSWALASSKPSYTFSELTTTPTTLQGYGITDAYTKTEVDGLVSGVLHYKGTKATVSALPSSGNAVGDVWHVTADSGEYAWDGSTWQELGSTVDLSGYVPTSTTVNGKALTGNISLTASDVSALPSNTTYVSSFNGSTGAITYTAPVTSVNGQTGAVTLSIPSATTVTNTLGSGTLIATINGTNIYAPAYTDADGVSY